MKKLIVFTIDNNYVVHLIVALQSFIEFNDPSSYQIGLLYSNISNDNLHKINKFTFTNNIELLAIKVEDIFKNIVVGYHFNSVIFYRLLIPNIFKGYEKVLYIDSDIIFLDNISEIFDINLEGCELAAIPRTFMGVPNYLINKTKSYFASGLLLLNIDLCNRNDILCKCLDFLSNNTYEMPDQDALNAVVENWKEIDIRFGVETAFLTHPNTLLKEALNNPAIIQFSGSSKPWHFRNNHPYKHLYWKYLRMTPYKYTIPNDLNIINILKWIVPKPIKNILKRR